MKGSSYEGMIEVIYDLQRRQNRPCFCYDKNQRYSGMHLSNVSIGRPI